MASGKTNHRRTISLRLVAGVILVSGLFATVGVATPAVAQSVIDGCAIVANPTPTHHTRCPGANLSGADLTGLNLSYADLDGVDLSSTLLAFCRNNFPSPPSCTEGTKLADAHLRGASLLGAEASQCLTYPVGPTINQVDCSQATFAGANLGGANLTQAELSGVDLSGAQLAGVSFTGATLVTRYLISPNGIYAYMAADLANAHLPRADLAGFDLAAVNFGGADLAGADLSQSTLGASEPGDPSLDMPTSFAGANLTRANFSGTNLGGFIETGGTYAADLSQAVLRGANVTATPLVPTNQTVPRTSSKGAVVTWPTPSSQPGATPDGCRPPSGSRFKVGTTTVKCFVIDDFGNRAAGTFTVTVM